jgi:chromosome partitioning protein
MTVLDTQMHERDAFRAVFAFGGSLQNLDKDQVSNIPAAINNARALVGEVVGMLKAINTPGQGTRTEAA